MMQISEPAEYVILGLLKTHPMYGYEMFQYFENGTLGQIVHLEMSQMYAFLKKLEHMNYIKARLEQQRTRPPRKIFHLTDDGHDIFFTWLTQAVEKPRDIRILFLIKLYFVQHFLPAQSGHLVELQIAACQRFLKHLEAQRQAGSYPSYQATQSGGTNEEDYDTSDAAFFNHIVLRSRIHQTRALLNWLDELQKEVINLLDTSS